MRKFSMEKAILFMAAGFAAYNFGLAGGYIEGKTFSAGGLLAGVVVNVSLAIAASRYGSLKGDKRTAQARAAFVVMLVLSPMLVSPVIFYSLPESFLGHWALRAAWSVGWPLAADLAIVLAGAVSGRGLIQLGEGETRSKVAGSVAQRRSKSLAASLSVAEGRSASRSASLTAKIYRCECGQTFANRYEYSGHSRTCETRRALKESKDLTPVELAPLSAVVNIPPNAKSAFRGSDQKRKETL